MMDETPTYGDDYVWVSNPEQHPAEAAVEDTSVSGKTQYEGAFQPFTCKGDFLVGIGDVDTTKKEGLYINAQALGGQIPEGYAARVPNGFEVRIDPEEESVETKAYITGDTDCGVILGTPDSSRAQDWVGRFYEEETVVSTPFFGKEPLVERIVREEQIQTEESPDLGGVESFLDGGPT